MTSSRKSAFIAPHRGHACGRFAMTMRCRGQPRCSRKRSSVRRLAAVPAIGTAVHWRRPHHRTARTLTPPGFRTRRVLPAGLMADSRYRIHGFARSPQQPAARRGPPFRRDQKCVRRRPGRSDRRFYRIVARMPFRQRALDRKQQCSVAPENSAQQPAPLSLCDYRNRSQHPQPARVKRCQDQLFLCATLARQTCERGRGYPPQAGRTPPGAGLGKDRL